MLPERLCEEQRLLQHLASLEGHDTVGGMSAEEQVDLLALYYLQEIDFVVADYR